MSFPLPSIDGRRDWRTANLAHVCSLGNATNARLNHITLVMGAFVIDAKMNDNDIAEIAALDVAKFNTAMTTLRSILKPLGSIDSQRGGFRFIARLEWDIIKASGKLSDTKRALFKEMGADLTDLTTADRAVLVPHFHMILDTAPSDHDTVKKAMVAVWGNNHHALRVDPFRRRNTVAYNLDRVGAYDFKLKFKHSNTFDGEDGPTKMTEDYAPKWESFVRRLVISAGLDNLVATNIRAPRGQKSSTPYASFSSEGKPIDKANNTNKNNSFSAFSGNEIEAVNARTVGDKGDKPYAASFREYEPDEDDADNTDILTRKMDRIRKITNINN